jgi:hypothetical protein
MTYYIYIIFICLISHIYILFVIRLVYWYYLNFYTTHKAPLFWGTHPSIYLFSFYCYPKAAQYYLRVCLWTMFTNQSSIHSLDKAPLLWVSIHGSIYLVPLPGTSTSYEFIYITIEFYHNIILYIPYISSQPWWLPKRPEATSCIEIQCSAAAACEEAKVWQVAKFIRNLNWR